MTISSQTSKAAFSGNGVSTAFPLPFPYLREADIKALLRHEGFETPLELGTHYTLSGAGSAQGGALVMNLPPATGQTLVVYRAPAIVQEVDYVENSAFPAETHEAALDLLTMICQSLQEQLGRAVLYPVSTPADDVLGSQAFLAATAQSRDAARSAEQNAFVSAGQAGLFASQAAASAASAEAVAQTADGLVKVSVGDAAARSLSSKLLAGNGLAEGIENPGGDEALRLAVALADGSGLEFEAGLLRVKCGEGLARTASGLTADAGTGPGQLVRLDANGRLPALDARNLTNVSSGDQIARDNAAMGMFLAQLSAERASGPVPGGILNTFKTEELSNIGGVYNADGDYYSNQTGGGGLSAPNNLTADGMSSFAAAFVNATYAPWKAFNGADKSTTTAGWQSPNDGQVIGKYIGRHFGATGHVVRRILIWNSQYSSGWRNGVKEFWVEGSNDAVPNGAGGLSTVGTWTKIPVVAVNGGGVVVYPDTARINQEAGDGVAPTAELILGGNIAYKAVRLGFVSASWGGGSPDYAHIREIEMYDTLTVTDMTLTSAGLALGRVPAKASLYLLHKAIDPVSLNTDLVVSVSRGSGWTTATDLATLCAYDGEYFLRRATVDLSALASGSTAYWRVQTFNTKAQQVRGALLWAE